MSPPRQRASRRLTDAQVWVGTILGTFVAGLALSGLWFSNAGASHAGDQALSFAAWAQLGGQANAAVKPGPVPTRGEARVEEGGRPQDRSARLQQDWPNANSLWEVRRPGSFRPLDRTQKRAAGKLAALPSGRELRLTIDSAAFAYDLSERRQASEIVECLRPRRVAYASSAPRGPPAI